MAEFTRTGFRGGLNWYRDIDRTWELIAPFDSEPVSVPALYIVGDRANRKRPGREVLHLGCVVVVVRWCGYPALVDRSVEVYLHFAKGGD